MNEQDLLKQLNNLNNIKPSAEWKKESRDILLNQIHNTEDVKISKFKIFMEILPRQLVEQAAQPAMAVFLILLFVLGGGIFGLKAAQDTKPGDSLYIAKIISEKAYLALTFDKKKKAKLGIEFASNRTKEMESIMNSNENGDKKERTEKLAEGFRKEITAVKTRIVEMNIENSNNNTEMELENEEDLQIFSANIGKTDEGMQIGITITEDTEESQNAQNKITEDAEDIIDVEILDTTSTSTESDLDKALGEAEELFNNEDYEGALDKLTEVNNIINNLETGSSTELIENKPENSN